MEFMVATIDEFPSQNSITRLDSKPSSGTLSTIADDESDHDCYSNHAKGCLKGKEQSQSLSEIYMPNRGVGNKVKWLTVEIYHHTMELGDHPDVFSGPPLTISWSARSKRTMSIDEFESNSNRVKPCRLFSTNERESILMKAGYSCRDMNKAVMEVWKIRHHRAWSKMENAESTLMKSSEHLKAVWRKMTQKC